MYGFGDGVEDDIGFFQFFFEGGYDRDGVEYGVDCYLVFRGNVSQNFLFVQWNVQFFVGFQQFWIDFIQVFWFFNGFWCGLVIEIVEIDFWIGYLSLVWFFYLLEVVKGIEMLFCYLFWFVFFCGQKLDGFFGKVFGVFF